MNSINRLPIVAAVLLAVASSQLTAYGFTPNAEDPSRGTLTVQFPAKGDKPGGIYQYDSFPAAEWEKFQASESKGSFFIHSVKGADAENPLYSFQKLTLEEVAEHITLPAPPAAEQQAETGGVNAAEELQEKIAA